MNSALQFDFTVNKENHTIAVKREFAADVSLVWDAYTKSEILDQWWAPKPWKAKTKLMDFREGGKWIYSMVGPNGEEHWARMDYHRINKPKAYSGADAFSDAEGNINKDMPVSDWDATFTPQGDHTLVEFTITYGDLSQLETTLEMGFKEGLSMAMETLDQLLPQLKK